MEKETLFNLIATVEGLKKNTNQVIIDCLCFNSVFDNKCIRHNRTIQAYDSKMSYFIRQHKVLEKRFRYLDIYRKKFIRTKDTSFSYVYPSIPKKQWDIYIDELKSLKEGFTNLLCDLLIHYNRINKNSYERLHRNWDKLLEF